MYTKEQLLEIGKQAVASGKWTRHSRTIQHNWKAKNDKTLICTECHTEKTVLIHNFQGKYYSK